MPLEPPEVYPQGFQSPAAAVFMATKPLLLPGSSQLDSLSPCFFYLWALVSSPSGYLFPPPSSLSHPPLQATVYASMAIKLP